MARADRPRPRRGPVSPAAAAEDALSGRRVAFRDPAEPRAPRAPWRTSLWRLLEAPAAGPGEPAVEVAVAPQERAAVRAFLAWRARWARARAEGPGRDRGLAAALALAERHAALARLIPASRPPRVEPRSASTFEALAEAIAYQQLSGKAAATIWGRVEALFPRGLTPAAVLRARPERLRAAGLSRAKVAAVRDLAAHVDDGRLVPEALRRCSDEEVVARLTCVRGIGPWSAHMHLLFALQRPDVWPTGDLGVRLGLARVLGLAEPPAPRRVEALGEPFRPYRSTLAWYAWRAVEIGFA